MHLRWMKARDGSWPEFQRTDLSRVNAFGVYVIWCEGAPGQVVYVGQGDIRTRLTADRSNSVITGYAANGTLRVTWAAVPRHQIDGVERYLADLLHPRYGGLHPQVTPIAVNW